MSHHASVTVSFREIAWLAICATLIAGAFLYGNADTRAPLSSAETRFVEVSPGGLRIVPASCPSDPHDGGTCSGNGQCNINFVPSPVAQGQNSTLFWSATSPISPVTLSYPGGSEQVANSGSKSVAGDQTKTYTLSYQGLVFGGGGNVGVPGTISCSATLTVSSGQCPAGQHLFNGVCVCDVTNQPPVNGQCLSSGQCTASFNPTTVAVGGTSQFAWTAQHAGIVYYPGGSFPAPASGSGSVGGNPGETSKTYRFVDGVNGAQCAAALTICPAGYTVQNGICTPPAGQCTAQYFCQGNDLYQRTAQCTNQFVQHCTWGCGGNGCLGPPHPTGNITATPSLVRREDTTVVSWTTQYTTSCTVTENNPDITDSWTGASGTHTSSPLTQQTIYTLTCTGVDGSTLTDRVTVNIVPIEDEK